MNDDETKATHVSRFHGPPPILRAELGFMASFTAQETKQLKAGLHPTCMEDKWRIFLSGDWLRFHRSWTGAFLFGVQLKDTEDGSVVTDSWVNRDPEQYRSTDLSYDKALLGFLIDALLLQRPALFPIRRDQMSPPGVMQHHLVGRGYPETIIDDEA